MGDEHDGLWVRSDVVPDGTYSVAINFGPGRSWVLNRDQAVAYAVACTARATETEHDAAVFTLLKHLGVPEHDAGMLLVRDVRPERPEPDHTPTEPLRFTGGVNRQGRPFITITLDGEEAGQVTTSDLREHASAALSILTAADLDAGLRRVLVSSVGLDDETARSVVGGLGEFWPDKQTLDPQATIDAATIEEAATQLEHGPGTDLPTRLRAIAKRMSC